MDGKPRSGTNIPMSAGKDKVKHIWGHLPHGKNDGRAVSTDENSTYHVRHCEEISPSRSRRGPYEEEISWLTWLQDNAQL
jgi:hypothetical protein